MFDRRFFAEAVTLVVLAAVCGTAANVFAARDRKLTWAGDYPNATVMPKRPAFTAPVTPEPDPQPVIDPSYTADPLETQPAETATSPDATTAPAVAPATTTPATPPAAAATPPVPVPVPQPPAKPKRVFLPTPDTVSEEITNEEARQLYEDGAIFLDARRTAAFREGRIPGSRPFAVWESDIDAKVTAFFDEVTDQSQPIVVYCTGGNCEDSHMLAQKLWGIGYETMLIYTDGWPGWLKIGGPVER
jgi:rhodanese-related sulfurtransferase